MTHSHKRIACIFDLDGTLVDSEFAYSQALAALGIDSNSLKYRQARDTVKKRLGKGHVSSHNRLLYFKELLELSHQFSPSNLCRMIQIYEEQIYMSFKDQWSALNRNQLFKSLSKNFDLAILTNETTRTQVIKLNALDPSGIYFKHVITSEEIGCEKPESKMFQAVLDKLNLLPSQCYMIGDDLEFDILPALCMGMQAIMTLEFSRQTVPIRKDIHTITKLDDLIGYFKL